MTSLVFDSAIYGFLAVDGLLAAAVGYKFLRRDSRKGAQNSASLGSGKKISLVILFLILVSAWVVIFYGSFIEPRIIIVTHQKIILAENPNLKLTVALIADIHAGPYKKEGFVERIAEKTAELKPDLILLAGDFVYGDTEEAKLLAPLKNLKANFGVFAILGNHDYGLRLKSIQDVSAEGEVRARIITKALSDSGVNVLINTGVVLNTPVPSANGRDVCLLGTDDLWTGRADIAAAKQTIGQIHPDINCVHILLAHNPDMVGAAAEQNIDLVLSGHTHGGQIRLPFLGPVPQIPDNLGKKYDRGLFKFGEKTQLFITSGIGEWGPRARLFNPPEIAVLQINF